MVFPMKVYKVRTAESNIRDVDIRDLLGPCSRVVEHTENCIIPPAVARVPFNLTEDVYHLLPLHVTEHRANIALEGDSKDRLAASQQAGIDSGQITEEGVDSRQPRIARPHTIAPRLFKVGQKLANQISRQLLYGEFLAVFSEKLGGEGQ